ncbi:MAG: hypothetical protein WC943_06850 [Elusimicrobiota bacterium]|jgi:hypothetical protein
MRKTLLMAAVLCAALGGAAFGAPEPAKPKPAKTWLRTWFEHLKQGLSESAVQGNYQKARVTAVAAVRGSEQELSDKNVPSWKAGARTRKALRNKAERQEFAKAVDLILEGKSEEGVAALEAFEDAHPKSPLLVDVREAREKARQMDSPEVEAGSAPAEAAPEAATPEPSGAPPVKTP